MPKPRRKPAKLTAATDRTIAEVDKPFNARITSRSVPDPFQAGYRITATASLRDDPLGRLHARHQIDEAQYAAGHFLQGMIELAGTGSVQAMDPTKEPVDGRGQAVEPITDAQLRAGRRLREAREALGKSGYALVMEVLGERHFIEQCVRARGQSGEAAVKFWGRRFRECLETIAEEFGFTGQAPAARKAPADVHRLNAVHAENPLLHQAVRRARELV